MLRDCDLELNLSRILIAEDSRFYGIPMLIETEKGEGDDGREFDRINLATLRRLARAACR